MTDWIVNDCVDTVEVLHHACGTETKYAPVSKQRFLDSTWVSSQEAYVSKDSMVLSVKEFPRSVRYELERIRLSGNLDNKAAELNEKRTNSEKSDTRRNYYSVLIVLTAAFGPDKHYIKSWTTNF